MHLPLHDFNKTEQISNEVMTIRMRLQKLFDPIVARAWTKSFEEHPLYAYFFLRK